MPNTIKFSDNPNEETAFVTQDGGQRNRAVLTAAISGDIEYPNNPNSTKVTVTVDGVKHKAVAVADITGGGGGGGDSHNKGWFATQAALEAAYATAEDGDWAIVGETDTVWVWDSDSTSWKDTDSKAEVTPDMVIIEAKVMPVASSTPADAIYQYTGATNANYTQNYIYKNVKTATYTGTVSFEAASLSGTTIACSGDDFAAFLTEAGADPTPIVSGTMTYEADATGWRLVGKDSNNDTVTTFLEYVEDYQDAGFTFTGTPQDGDVVAFTCTVEEASATYAWTRIDVQPAPEALPDQTGQNGKFLTTNGTTASWGTVESLPSQTGQSGKFLTTDGTDASWSDKPLVNTATGTLGLTIEGTPSSATNATNICVGSVATGTGSMAIGRNSSAGGEKSIALGLGAVVSVGRVQAIQIGNGTNSDANTFKVANANGNYEIMSADGTVPTARLTKVNTTATLAVADWSSNTQTVTVSGVKADSVVFVSPAPASASDYASAGILCTGQSADSLTFTATTTPSVAIDVNIVCL